MKRSRNPRKPDVVGEYSLRPLPEYRRKLLEVDFLCPQEQVIEAVLGACVKASLQHLTLTRLHWIIAALLLRNGVRTIPIAEKCSQCGAMLELQLDLEKAVCAAEPVLQQGLMDTRLRLPTLTDLARARSPDDLVALCSLQPIQLTEAERLLQDADPLGWIALRASCCMCGSPVDGVVDLAGKWLATERQVAANLLEEIHTLAWNYHWSERDILDLSDVSRRRYIAMCNTESGRGMLEQNIYV